MNAFQTFFQQCCDELTANKVDSPFAVARLLFAHFTPADFSQIPHGGVSEILSIESQQNIEKAIQKIISEDYPVQYLIGEAPFRLLDLKVTEAVLIPRPETEQLLDEVLPLIKPHHDVLDLCTGSGAIALAVATEKKANVMASDLSSDALSIAKENAQRYHMNISFILSDLFENIPKGMAFDFILSNPPYISKSDYDILPQNVQLHEPRMALTDESNGVEITQKIIQQSFDYLKKGGYLFLEIGETQEEEIKNELNKMGYSDVCIWRDSAHRIRFAKGKK